MAFCKVFNTVYNENSVIGGSVAKAGVMGSLAPVSRIRNLSIS